MVFMCHFDKDRGEESNNLDESIKGNSKYFLKTHICSLRMFLRLELI